MGLILIVDSPSPLHGRPLIGGNSNIMQGTAAFPVARTLQVPMLHHVSHLVEATIPGRRTL